MCAADGQGRGSTKAKAWNLKTPPPSSWHWHMSRPWPVPLHEPSPPQALQMGLRTLQRPEQSFHAAAACKPQKPEKCNSSSGRQASKARPGISGLRRSPTGGRTSLLIPVRKRMLFKYYYFDESLKQMLIRLFDFSTTSSSISSAISKLFNVWLNKRS